MSLQPRDATLRQVHWRGAPQDAARARQRLERALSLAEWTPPGMRPGALLLVRRLAVRTPGAAPDGPADGGAWGRTIGTALRRQAERARRPWTQGDAASADAVIFDDEAELAACLLRERLRGAGDAWWCRAAWGATGWPAWLARRVLARGEVLVPVLAMLADAGLAVEGLRQVDDGLLADAPAAIRRSHGVALPMRRAVSEALPDDIQGTVSDADRARRRNMPSTPDGDARHRLVALVPEMAAPRLGRAQRTLLGLALGVHRAPAWAATAAFGGALFECVEAAEASPPANEAPARAAAPRVTPSGSPPASGNRARAERLRFAPTSDAGTAAAANDAPGSSTRAAAPAIDPSRRAVSMAEAAERDMHAQPPVADPTPAVEAATPAMQARDAVATATPASDQYRTAPSTLPTPLATAADIETEFGGLFYLLNVALSLELYGDFTRPAQRGLAISPWDLLAVVGLAWFGAAFARDPLAATLASLAGRPVPSQPDLRSMARTWQAPDAALRAWPAATLVSYYATQHRLRALHSAGFALFDLPRDRALAPRVQLRALCDAHESLRGAALRRDTAAACPRCAGLAGLLALLDARTALALGDDAPAEPAALHTLVARHAAHVHCSASAIDVRLVLAGLPLPLRLAGLDRDPGWIPAAGRAIAFHFA